MTAQNQAAQQISKQIESARFISFVPETTNRYPVDWFDRRSGLATSQVHQTAISSDGRLWAATPAGLASYDGVRISKFGRDEGLECQGLRAIGIDDRDRIWIGSDAGLQLMQIQHNALVPLNWDAIGLIDAISVTGEGATIATPHGLYSADINGQVARSCNAHWNTEPISSVATSEKGTQFIVSPARGLGVIRENEVSGICEISASCIPHIASLGRLRVITHAADDLYLIGGDRGIALINSHGQVFSKLETSEPVSALCWDGGDIWAAVGASVFRCRLDNETIHIVDRALAHMQVNHLMKDRLGNIWVSTDNAGIGRINGLRSIVAYPETPQLGAILCVRNTAEGHIWGGTSGLSFNGCDPVLPGIKVWDAIEDRMGVLWAATEKGLYALINPALPTPFHHDILTLAAPCRALALFNDGLLIGSIRGLVKTNRDGAHEILGDDDQPIGYVYSVRVGRAGNAWIATLGNGLWSYNGKKLSRVVGGSLSETCNVYAVTEDATGALMIAHDNCISRLSDGHVPKLVWKTKEAVAAWALESSLDGRLLAGSSRGLLIFEAGTGAFLQQLYDPSGSNNWEFTTSRSLCVDDEDNIYCGLACGLAAVKIRKLSNWGWKPKAQLEAVRWIGVEIRTDDTHPVVDEGKWRVEFDIRTCWFVDEAVCEMRYRMLGFDSKWSGFAPVSSITYSSLPPGVYTIEVELRSPIAGVGPTAGLFTFEVRGKLNAFTHNFLRMLPEGFGRNGFYVRVKRALLDRKKRELEQLIRLRTAELQGINEKLTTAHDKLDVLAHSDTLTGIANRRSFERSFEIAFDRATATAGALSVIMIDVDHFKTYNDHYGHSAGDDALRRVAQAIKTELRKSDDIAARIGGEEFAVVLPDTNDDEAAHVAARLNVAISTLNITHEKSATADHITISAGIASFGPKTEDRQSLLRVADQHLYRAKAAGRDRWSA